MEGQPSRVLYSVREVCAMLGVSKPHLWGFIRRGELPVIRLGRAVRIHRDDVDALLVRDSQDAA